MEHFKPFISLLIVLALAFSLAACGSGSGGATALAENSTQSQTAASAEDGKQIAARTYFRYGRDIDVALDLTGGWSAEFASAAMYLYDGPYNEDRETTAFGCLMNQLDYDQYAADFKDYDSFRQSEDGSLEVTDEEGDNRYIFPVTKYVYFLIVTKKGTDPEAVRQRFDVTAAPLNEDESIDYMELVNKTNPLPEDWEKKLKTTHMTNSLGDDVEVETNAYEAYKRLKAALEKKGVFVDLDSARRTVAEQQDILDRFTREYGADYAAKTVAAPGYSEHHTGLALDLYLIVDGKEVTENEDLVKYPELWDKIHATLPKDGFILRYPEGKEHITGYGYEPWHIRYVGRPDAAAEMAGTGETLEEYLGMAEASDADLDLGSSERYSLEERAEAAVQVQCAFAGWKGCTLYSLRYAGDEFNTEENLKWLNSLNEGANYTEVAKFLTMFHSPALPEGTWEPNQVYEDYEWWLARTDKGGWEIVSQGY